jgi:hypothetical protein
VAAGSITAGTTSSPTCRGRRQHTGAALQRCRTGRRPVNDCHEIHAQLAGSCQHASRLFLFLDVLIDQLGERRHLGVAAVIVGPGGLESDQRLLGAVVLEGGLVVQVLLLGGFDERGVEELLIDAGMDPQGLADTARELLFSLAVSSLIESWQPTLELSVVRSERDSAPSCHGAPQSRPCSVLRLCPNHADSSW